MQCGSATTIQRVLCPGAADKRDKICTDLFMAVQGVPGHMT
jgi:hypothetical protein